MFAILAWSAFTGLTGVAISYAMLVSIRFAFGGMEAALAPAVSSAFSRWIPGDRRTTAFGIFLGGGRIGGALAPLLAAHLLIRHGWRISFAGIAVLGLVAPLVWLAAVPRQGWSRKVGSIRGREREHVSSFRMVSLLLVVFGYTVMWQFYPTWYPTYLVERRGFSLREAASYASAPFLVGIASNWAGGLLCDTLCRRIDTPMGRGLLGCASLASASALFFGGIIGPAKAAPWLFAAAAGAGDLILPIAWSAAADLGGRSAGAFAGLMNSASNLGGFVSPIILGRAIQQWGGWDRALGISMAATLVSALLWVPVVWPRKGRTWKVVASTNR